MIFKLFTLSLLSLSLIFPHGDEHDHHDHDNNNKPSYKPIGVIRGSVIDSMLDEVKMYASISLVKDGSEDIITGGISDKNGMFLIDKIPFGKYYVVIEYILSLIHI